jgi:hypothetical protein
MARRSAKTYRGVTEFPDGVWDEFVTWRTRKQDPNTAATYIKEQRDRNKQAAALGTGVPRPRPAG